MQVTLEHHTHAFAIQSLHHAYHVFGYEGALRHLQVYHGLQTLRPDSVPSNACTAGAIGAASTAIITGATINTGSASTASNPVNTVINEPISYTRTQIPEAGRCTKMLSNGNQCTFHKSGDSDFCTRHSKAELKEEVKEVEKDVLKEADKEERKMVVVTDDKKEKQRAYQAAYREKHKKVV
jgi:hypothetical protein